MSSPLLPPERIALTVARAQIKRGEDPTPNITAVLIMALARLVDKIGDEETQLQAITDAWNAYRESGGSRYSETMDNFVGVIMNVVEDNDE